MGHNHVAALQCKKPFLKMSGHACSCCCCLRQELNANGCSLDCGLLSRWQAHQRQSVAHNKAEQSLSRNSVSRFVAADGCLRPSATEHKSCGAHPVPFPTRSPCQAPCLAFNQRHVCGFLLPSVGHLLPRQISTRYTGLERMHNGLDASFQKKIRVSSATWITHWPEDLRLTAISCVGC